MSILECRSTRGPIRGKNLQFLLVLSMTMLFLFLTASHHNQIYAGDRGGVKKELSNGHNTTVRSAKTKIEEGQWNTGNQTVGMQGFSNVTHNGKVYLVWWQIGRGTNDGGNPRVVAEIGFSEIGGSAEGSQVHEYSHNVGNNDFFEIDPKGNGEVDFKFGSTTETLDWNDSVQWNSGTPPPTGLQWNNNEDISHIALNIENGTSSSNLPGTQSNPFEFSAIKYNDGFSDIPIYQWQRISSSPSTLVTNITSAGVTMYD